MEVSLTTKRCEIRKFKPSDVGGLFEVLSGGDVMKFVEPPFSYEQTEQFVREYGICSDPKIFALIYDKSKIIIGHLIFHRYRDDEIEQKYGENIFEIGFVIRKAFWGQGIASEVTEAVLEFSKGCEIDALVLECDKNNYASRRIAEKFGFELIAQEQLQNVCGQRSSLLTYVLKV